MSNKKKLAIIYDWIDKWGGVERVLLTFQKMFPDADFFTSYSDLEKATWASKLKIKTSFIQRLPSLIKNNRILSIPFYSLAFESFNFNQYDFVISITSSFAKSVITQPKTKHICYLLTPTRFLWSHKRDYLGNMNNLMIKNYIKGLKEWDLVASQRPDKIVSISQAVRDRCKKYYSRDSEVIYPPFDINYWNGIKKEIKNDLDNNFKRKKYFLVVSRLEKYKKVDLVIKTFNKLKKQLIIIGQGSEEKYLKQIAKSNIHFLKNLDDKELALFYSNSEALIMPQEEDFGYVSLEALFFGCPVISYSKGGVKEIVIDQKTGLFFNKQTEKSLKSAVERFSKIKYNLRLETMKYSKTNIERFSSEKFISSFKSLL